MMVRRRPAGKTRRAHRSRQERAPARPVPRRRFRAALFLHPAFVSALAGVALYVPALGHGWVWDDHLLIENNLLLRSLEGIGRLLVSDFWLTGSNASGLWRPWISLSYAIDGAVSGWNPFYFRLMNVLGNAAAAALVAGLVMQARAPRVAALFAGLWFALMPAHVESVAWISGRTDVYCTVFVLLAYWLDRRAHAAGHAWPGWIPALAFGLALLSKEAGLAFLPLIVLSDWMARRRSADGLRRTAAWVWPYIAIAAIYLAAHLSLVRAPDVALHGADLVRGRSFSTMLLMGPGYAVFLWPFFAHSPAATLSLPPTPWAPGVFLAAAFNAALLGGALVLLLRRAREALPLAWIVIAMLPVVAVNFSHGTLIYGERYFYLASAGAAWLAGVVLLRLAGRRVAFAAGAVAAALVLASGVQSLRTLQHWSDDASLFESMARLHPQNAMAHVRWATVLAERGRLADAARALEAASRLDPTRPDIASVRAQLHVRQGRWGEALAAADRALAEGANARGPRLLRITALLGLGRHAEAIQSASALRAGSPADPQVEALYGQALVAAGRPADASATLSRAIRLFPQDADLRYSLGLAESSANRLPQAAEAFRRTVALQPGHYDAWLQLAMTNVLNGDRAGALRALERAAALPAAADGRAATLRQALEGSSARTAP